MNQAARRSTVVAVVPGFTPDNVGIATVVRSLLEAGVPTLVVDDGSADASYLVELAALGADTKQHPDNRGIARSLNDGLWYAVTRGAGWLLTVDQDTVLPAGYAETLLSFVADSIGVVGAENIGDASGDLTYPVRSVKGHLLTDEVFQTGSLWSVDLLVSLGGFDETLGIDAVDAEACLRLRENGYAVAVAPGTRLEHRLGSTRQVRLLGKSVAATGHSPGRRESMVRNRVRLFPREFRQSPVHALRTLRRLAVNIALAVTVEDDRWAKAKGAARGLLPKGNG